MHMFIIAVCRHLLRMLSLRRSISQSYVQNHQTEREAQRQRMMLCAPPEEDSPRSADAGATHEGIRGSGLEVSLTRSIRNPAAKDQAPTLRKVFALGNLDMAGRSCAIDRYHGTCSKNKHACTLPAARRWAGSGAALRRCSPRNVDTRKFAELV